jgi:hypothetical protein
MIGFEVETHHIDDLRLKISQHKILVITGSIALLPCKICIVYIFQVEDDPRWGAEADSWNDVLSPENTSAWHPGPAATQLPPLDAKGCFDILNVGEMPAAQPRGGIGFLQMEAEGEAAPFRWKDGVGLVERGAQNESDAESDRATERPARPGNYPARRGGGITRGMSHAIAEWVEDPPARNKVGVGEGWGLLEGEI